MVFLKIASEININVFVIKIVKKKGDVISVPEQKKRVINLSLGLGTHFSSFIPRLFKINAIKTLVYRCYNLSSNWSLFDKEVNFLRIFFSNNGYPSDLVENCVSKFLNKLFASEHTRDHDTDKVYVKLPYYGH